MTTLVHAPSDGGRPSSEAQTIVKHTLGVWLGQLAAMAYGITDTVVAGRHSSAALAALSIGFSVYVSVYVALITIIQALLPIWAEHNGAKRFAELGRSLRQSLYLAAGVAVVGIGVLLVPGPVLDWAQVPQGAREAAIDYLAVISLGFIPALLFRIYATLNQSLGKPILVTVLLVTSLVLIKIPLSVALGLGASLGTGWTLEPMGAVGCAWATVCANVVSASVAWTLLKTKSLYKPYQLFSKMEPPDGRELARFLRLGVPTAVSVLVEVTSFTLMALFIARQGATASAAHQIASNLAALMFMLPMSLGIATSARVSHWRGAGRPDTAVHTLRIGLFITLGAAASLALGMLAGKDLIPNWYSQDPVVVTMASGLLVWIALFHIGDALQGFAGYVLRSYRITIAPMLVYSASLWGVGLGLAYAWAYVGLLGLAARPLPSTFWITSGLALAICATALLALLRWAVKHADGRN